MMRALAYSLTAALIVAFAGISAQAEDRMLAHDVYFSLKDNSPRRKSSNWMNSRTFPSAVKLVSILGTNC